MSSDDKNEKMGQFLFDCTSEMVICVFCGDIGKSFDYSPKMTEKHLVLCYLLHIKSGMPLRQNAQNFAKENETFKIGLEKDEYQMYRNVATVDEIKTELGNLIWRINFFVKDVKLSQKLKKQRK